MPERALPRRGTRPLSSPAHQGGHTLKARDRRPGRALVRANCLGRSGPCVGSRRVCFVIDILACSAGATKTAPVERVRAVVRGMNESDPSCPSLRSLLLGYRLDLIVRCLLLRTVSAEPPGFALLRQQLGRLKKPPRQPRGEARRVLHARRRQWCGRGEF